MSASNNYVFSEECMGSIGEVRDNPGKYKRKSPGKGGNNAQVKKHQ